MDSLHQALRGSQHQPSPGVPALQALQALLVVGAGGTLGSALLSEALVAGRFARVLALVAEPLASAVMRFDPWPQARLEAAEPVPAPAAVIVFERQRHSNGRDDVFVQPAPEDLLAWARRLHERGVKRLLVVVPHAPALMPQALAHGLASLDEAAVAALGFEHLVFLRAAQSLPRAATGGWMRRLASWWLSQLGWMVPQRQQPVRAAVLARCVVHLARRLPGLPQGTRVIAPETLWLWARDDVSLERRLDDGLPRPPGSTATAPPP